jgi:AraC-like DNA-binding protein
MVHQRRLQATGRVSDVVVEEPAIWVRRGPAPLMQKPHRHDDLELNYVVKGTLDYLFGGSPLQIRQGEVALFWGATPHRLVDDEIPRDSDNCWVHIPLATVFGWGLPDSNLRHLLTDRPIVLPAEAAGRDIESMFTSWLTDLDGSDTEQFALLEIHALVRRLIHFHRVHASSNAQDAAAARSRNDGMQHVVEMARFTVANFRSNISPADIARATHLNPNYAMTLFRETVGTTLGKYLTRCRIAEAQRLLLTTSMNTAEIAHAAGFGSQSNFYSHFTRDCGLSPSAYRHTFG